MADRPGYLVLFGSGETAAAGRRVFDWLFRRQPAPPRVAILETPAGFQPNSALVARRIAEFLEHHLQNYAPETVVVPARQRGTPFSPDDPALAERLLGATCLFLGPGSPTYAVRQLRGSVVWEAVRYRWLAGAALVLASAAVLAIGAYTLPVYEIYKAGADLGWVPGLDLLGPAGPSLVFIPHWDNREGGADLDTSRCYMGVERFARLRALLPADVVLVGIDEHTALVLDPAAAEARVLGQGTVTVERSGETAVFSTGAVFPLAQLGTFRWEGLAAALTPAWRERFAQWETTLRPAPSDAAVPPEVVRLVEQREQARRRRDWATADALRAEIRRWGFQVEDTPEGPRLRPLSPRR